jgi:hypothetical protein
MTGVHRYLSSLLSRHEESYYLKVNIPTLAILFYLKLVNVILGKICVFLGIMAFVYFRGKCGVRTGQYVLLLYEA